MGPLWAGSFALCLPIAAGEVGRGAQDESLDLSGALSLTGRDLSQASLSGTVHGVYSYEVG